ncbi:hypothetical protein CISG_01096 [Coccidioides immitis RMSCC 3703]|uniref:Uncharacterized protein n=1 Tax=Coccidioides immitis RMSCC 3703 TaxID=454286 RepID=A0A0J8TRJ9_COCIT|nr:hypothetical protein CISG_01096 [Coccidioides immitis RMSCC 3703]
MFAKPQSAEREDYGFQDLTAMSFNQIRRATFRISPLRGTRVESDRCIYRFVAPRLSGIMTRPAVNVSSFSGYLIFDTASDAGMLITQDEISAWGFTPRATYATNTLSSDRCKPRTHHLMDFSHSEIIDKWPNQHDRFALANEMVMQLQQQLFAPFL